jgi:hypothetical protein
MPEDITPESIEQHETPAEREVEYRIFKDRIDDIFTDQIEHVITKADENYPELTVQFLPLLTAEDHRIVLKRVAPGSAPVEGHPLEDMEVMMPLNGSYKTGKVDYSFGHDGVLRKQTIDRSAGFVQPEPTSTDSPAEWDLKFTEAQRQANESAANFELESQLGLNNMPTSAAETRDVLEIITKARPIVALPSS